MRTESSQMVQNMKASMQYYTLGQSIKKSYIILQLGNTMTSIILLIIEVLKWMENIIDKGYVNTS